MQAEEIPLTWAPLKAEDLMDEYGKPIPPHECGREVDGSMVRNLMSRAEIYSARGHTDKMRHPFTGRLIKVNGPSYQKLLKAISSKMGNKFVLVMNKQGFWIAADDSWKTTLLLK